VFACDLWFSSLMCFSGNEPQLDISLFLSLLAILFLSLVFFFSQILIFLFIYVKVNGDLGVKNHVFSRQ
jgi:hypothetical protein